jgi:hypothetical protein
VADDRDVRFDIIADDKASKPLSRVGEAAEDAADNLDDLKRSAKDAGDEVDRVGKKSDKASGRLARLGASAQLAARTTTKLVGSVAMVGSAIGPLALGLMAAGQAAAQFALSVAPAAAVLPSLAAGLLFVKATAAIAGPAIKKRLEPIGEELGKLGERIGKMATRHVPQLWAAFKKDNLPRVRANMELIAQAVDKAAVRMGNWVNSTRGHKAISLITGQTAGLMQRLADRAADVGIALGNMVNRVGDEGFKRLPAVIDKVADAVVRLIDGVSRGDVKKAFSDIANIGVKFRNAFVMLRDVGKWMGENTTAVKAFSDALAMVAIVAGVATGGWLIALGGALTLLANHWQEVKAAGQKALEWFRRFSAENPEVQQVLDNLRAGLARVQQGFRQLVDMVRPHVMPLMAALKDAWIEMAPAMSKLAPIIGAFVQAQLQGLGALLVVLLKVVTAFIRFMTASVRAMKIVGTQAALLKEQIRAHFFRAALSVGESVQKMLGFLGRMPGPAGAAARRAATAVGREMGRMRGSVADADAAVKRLRDRMAGLKSKKVRITVEQIYRNYGGENAARGRSRVQTGSLQARAAGGPVRRGASYWVGERGPEVVTMPAAGRVLSARDSAAAVAGGPGTGGGVHVTVNGFVGNSRELAAAVMRAVDTAHGRGLLRGGARG